MSLDYAPKDLTIAEFVQCFGEIRVGLNVSQILAESLPIERRTINSRASLGALGLPWYLDPHEEECAFDAPGARRIHIAETPRLLDGPLSHRAAAIAEKAEWLASSVEPISLEMPAYCRGTESILLDGCHTAVALMSSVAEFEVRVFAIRGPDDAEYLADLAVR